MQRTTQEARKEEVSNQKLKQVSDLVFSNLDDVEISQDMPSEDKVLWLGNIVTHLKKKVTELEEKRIPSTPLEVLESRRDVATQAAKIIDKAEQTCAKVMDQVSRTWEALMENEQSRGIAGELTVV